MLFIHLGTLDLTDIPFIAQHVSRVCVTDIGDWGDEDYNQVDSIPVSDAQVHIHVYKLSEVNLLLAALALIYVVELSKYHVK